MSIQYTFWRNSPLVLMLFLLGTAPPNFAYNQPYGQVYAAQDDPQKKREAELILLFIKGDSYKKQGKFTEALPTFQQALE